MTLRLFVFLVVVAGVGAAWGAEPTEAERLRAESERYAAYYEREAPPPEPLSPTREFPRPADATFDSWQAFARRELSAAERESFDAALAHLQDPYSFHRLAAARTLARLGHVDALAPLEAALANRFDSPAVRREVAKAVGSIADRRSVEILIAGIDDLGAGFECWNQVTQVLMNPFEARAVAPYSARPYFDERQPPPQPTTPYLLEMQAKQRAMYAEQRRRFERFWQRRGDSWGLTFDPETKARYQGKYADDLDPGLLGH